MKRFFILLYASLTFACTSCEKRLPLNIPENDEWGITLNAIASPDTTFRAYVTHAYLSSEAPEYRYATSYLDNYIEREPFKHYYSGYVHLGKPFNDSNYKIIKESVLADAKVDLTINGKTTYPMTYNDSTFCFQSNYTPAPGDQLEVKVSSATGEQTIVHTQVPHPQKLEILDVKLGNGEMPDWLDKYIYKGHVRMKLRLHDPSEEKNYYRLRVRTIMTQIRDSLYSAFDIYQSSDPIFRDERLVSDWGAYEAYFSDVFDDKMINGKQHEFDIVTYALHLPDKKLEAIIYVSLQSITEDYYLYLKSLQLYRLSTINTYGEPVYIHTNNEGGWGMLGALSGEVHRIEIPNE